jgi:hypothetical protein
MKNQPRRRKGEQEANIGWGFSTLSPGAFALAKSGNAGDLVAGSLFGPTAVFRGCRRGPSPTKSRFLGGARFSLPPGRQAGGFSTLSLGAFASRNPVTPGDLVAGSFPEASYHANRPSGDKPAATAPAFFRPCRPGAFTSRSPSPQITPTLSVCGARTPACRVHTHVNATLLRTPAKCRPTVQPPRSFDPVAVLFA